MKKIWKIMIITLVVMLLFIMSAVTINATSSCNHTTKNGQCSLCNAIIVEVGSTVKIEKLANSKGDWLEYSNVISIPEISSTSTSIGSYVTCLMSATIKGVALGEADLFLLVKDSNQIIEQYKVMVIEHEHVFITSNIKSGTCIDKATLKYTCACGYSYEAETEVDKTNHVETRTLKKVLIEPTCTEVGSGEYECACSYVFTQSIPAINHSNATAENGTPATCTQTGFTAGKYCPDCVKWIEGHEIIPITAHTYTSSITTEPTCWRDGVLTYTCECGDSYTEDIEKNDHDYNEWWVKTKPTCTKAGLEWTYCRNCDNDFEREIPATGHDVIEYVMKASTDENAAYGGDGAYMTACDVCNEVFKQEFFARPAEYKLSSSEVTYNGKVRKPSVTVKDADGKKLVEGTDYDVIYPDGMKLPGKYDIEIFFKGNYIGGKHLTFTIAPKATTGVKAKTQTTKTITLTWSATTGATGYRVYQYSPSKGKYVVKASVKGTTTYKVSSLKVGTTYKFKIKPYVKSEDGTVIWGSASSTLATATKPTTPKLKSVTTSSGKVTLTWDNVSGESGYQVYYSTSKSGTYEKMKSVSADTVKYTTSKLTAGKTYYFKVRAYVKVDGKVIYGDFSDIKSATIPAVYYITKTGKKYHVDGCRSLSKSKIQISYSNAVARGYTPCDACII